MRTKATFFKGIFIGVVLGSTNTFTFFATPYINAYLAFSAFQNQADQEEVQETTSDYMEVEFTEAEREMLLIVALRRKHARTHQENQRDARNFLDKLRKRDPYYVGELEVRYLQRTGVGFTATPKKIEDLWPK